MSAIIGRGASYFRKLPARGDFVKGGTELQLIQQLDRWTTAWMALLAEDPRWKLLFDSAAELDFAFVSGHRSVSVIGHLRPSRDAAGRRFPFIAAAVISRNDTEPFRCGPVGFTAAWSTLRRIVAEACCAANPTDVLAELGLLDCTAAVAHALDRGPLHAYAQKTTLNQLAMSIGSKVTPQTVRRQILAIGLLLRPALARRTLSIEKGLCLPLPANAHERNDVAALWLFLVTTLLHNTPCEMQLLLGRMNAQDKMLIGFSGAAPLLMLAMLSPAARKESVIDLDDPEWIEGHPDLSAHSGIARLSSYLMQPEITLESVLITFRNVFLGK